MREISWQAVSILAVEDDGGDFGLIRAYLNLAELGAAGGGKPAAWAKTLSTGIAAARKERPDVVLLDLALLEYSRVSRIGEPPAMIESGNVLEEVLQFLQPAIAKAQAKLTIFGGWPCIMACRNEILRLLQNLIGNTIKYRVAGRVPEISLTSHIINREWQVRFADNGTGIGLALCRKIAEHHEGSVWAESEGEGMGSKFYFSLPVLRDAQRPPAGKTAELAGDV